MSHLLIGLFLAVLMAANAPAAASNRVVQTTGGSEVAPGPNDPLEKEFQKLMAEDDAAQADADRWIRENQKFATEGAGEPPAMLRHRIQERFETVRKAYEDFLQRHPNYVRARVAYASFLGDTKNEDAAREQLEKALALDTNDPAIYNNLANIYGHSGPVKKAFEFYAKACQLNPLEPIYYQNWGTTVFLFRRDAMEYYGINQEQVFAKSFELYSNAMRLDPENFTLATDVAQTYYAIKPLRVEAALRSWTNALHLAQDEIQREGVYTHLARIKILAGRFAEARAQLGAITNAAYGDLKKRLVRSLELREKEAKGTNAPPKTGDTGQGASGATNRVQAP